MDKSLMLVTALNPYIGYDSEPQSLCAACCLHGRLSVGVCQCCHPLSCWPTRSCWMCLRLRSFLPAVHRGGRHGEEGPQGGHDAEGGSDGAGLPDLAAVRRVGQAGEHDRPHALRPQEEELKCRRLRWSDLVVQKIQPICSTTISNINNTAKRAICSTTEHTPTKTAS